MDETPSQDGADRVTPLWAAPGRFVLILALAFEGGLVFVAWGLGRALGRWPPVQWRLDIGSFAWGVLAVAPLLIALQWSRVSDLAPLQRLTRAVSEKVVPLFAGCSALDLLLISIAAGVGEELLFRGVIQPHLADWLGPVIGVTLTSLIFGLVHPVSITYVAYAALVGLYLGVLAAGLENVVVPITTHALYDFLALYFLTREASSSVPRGPQDSTR